VTDLSKSFTLTRVFDATPEQVWRAWVEPDQAAVWTHPTGVHVAPESMTIDARVGGSFAYTMVDDVTGTEYPSVGEYREVAENARLVFTWSDLDEVDDPALVTVTIEDLGGLTRLTFLYQGMDGMPGDDDLYDGWESVIDQLAAHLGQTAVAG
jgi:uncharacterized protein YndB with AHSA1/START domain